MCLSVVFIKNKLFLVRIHFTYYIDLWAPNLHDSLISILVFSLDSVWMNAFGMSHVATSLFCLASIIEVIIANSVRNVELETCSHSTLWIAFGTVSAFDQSICLFLKKYKWFQHTFFLSCTHSVWINRHETLSVMELFQHLHCCFFSSFTKPGDTLFETVLNHMLNSMDNWCMNNMQHNCS